MATESRMWSEEFHIFAFLTFLIGSIVIGMTAWWSYDNYLDMRNFYDTHQTVYKGAIDFYVNHVNLLSGPTISEISIKDIRNQLTHRS